MANVPVYVKQIIDELQCIEDCICFESGVVVGYHISRTLTQTDSEDGNGVVMFYDNDDTDWGEIPFWRRCSVVYVDFSDLKCMNANNFREVIYKRVERVYQAFEDEKIKDLDIHEGLPDLAEFKTFLESATIKERGGTKYFIDKYSFIGTSRASRFLTGTTNESLHSGIFGILEGNITADFWCGEQRFSVVLCPVNKPQDIIDRIIAVRTERANVLRNKKDS
jgi:hypothetical protein